MADDLLVQLLDIWIRREKAPDKLSAELDCSREKRSDIRIYFLWANTNVEKDYGYTKKRFSAVRKRFYEYQNPLGGKYI